MQHKATHKKKGLKHRRWLEYFLINIYVFASIGLISLFVFNVSIFDPFTNAFKDFTLTDLYYAKLKNQDKIYRGPLVLMNVGNKERKEIAFMLQLVSQSNPKVIGIDVAFSEKKDSASDAYLKTVLNSIPNKVMGYTASFDSLTDVIDQNPYFQLKEKSYVNMVATDRELSTVRSFFPYKDNQEAFTTSIIAKYDSSLLEPLAKRKNKKTEIRYYGNIQNFHYYNFDDLLDSSFRPDSLKGKIVLIGYFGTNTNITRPSIDEDRFYTPLNQRISGRSYPDMYGAVIHANILRMALDKDYVYDVPTWLNWVLAFLLSWILIPIFCKWYIHHPLWAHFNTKMAQVILSILFVFITVWVYPRFNIKIDSAAVLVSVLLLGDLILFYDALVKLLHKKFKWKFHSIFFEGAHGH